MGSQSPEQQKKRKQKRILESKEKATKTNDIEKSNLVLKKLNEQNEKRPQLAQKILKICR